MPVQVCVIVDEEGTEAAAVTAVVMMRATAVMAATPVIRCASLPCAWNAQPSAVITWPRAPACVVQSALRAARALHFAEGAAAAAAAASQQGNLTPNHPWKQ
jgi:hypothetical protein